MHDIDDYMGSRSRGSLARALEVNSWRTYLGIFLLHVPNLNNLGAQVTDITQACSTHCSEEATDVS